MSPLSSQTYAQPTLVLFRRLQSAKAVILKTGTPPWRAVADGDTRRRPMAWIDDRVFDDWQAQGLLREGPKGWEILSRRGPRPLVAETAEGTVNVQINESWMQRLARDLDLEGPLAEAGYRLVADGLATQVGALSTGMDRVFVDRGPRTSNAEEIKVSNRLDARRRVRRALAPLSHHQSRMAEGICLQDHSLLHMAEALGVSGDEAGSLFTLALVKLSRHYGTMPGWTGSKRAPR